MTKTLQPSPDGEPIIELEGVSLRYRLAKQRIPSLKEYAIHWMRGSLRHEDLWALRDIDLRIERGESLGIVGRNGAGKSTLLKVVSKVLRPSRGTVTVRGAVAPILELGTGFDYELTGLENIELNSLLLGHTKREIMERRDAIIQFSGLQNFIYSPVRNYSSGMLARLGFAIATAWDPDVLILDEVLAVGDARFIRRCEERLEELHAAGTTMLLVSHSPDSIRNNCRRVVWIDEGQVRMDGAVEDVLDAYADFSETVEQPDGETIDSALAVPAFAAEASAVGLPGDDR